MLFDIDKQRINERNKQTLRNMPVPNSYKKGGAAVIELYLDGPYHGLIYPRMWRIQEKYIKGRNMRKGQIGDLILKTKIHSTNNGCVPVSIGLAPPIGTYIGVAV
jgi:hypothetical protein